jgi:ribosomal protein S4E
MLILFNSTPMSDQTNNTKAEVVESTNGNSASTTTTTTTLEVETTTGDTIVLDTSTQATKDVFGFSAGETVRFMKSRLNGKEAKILGANDGMLWFTVLGSSSEGKVQTTSCTCAAEYIRQYGWMVMS